MRIWDLAGASLLTTLHYPAPLKGALCFGPAGEIVAGVGWDLVVAARTVT